MKKFSLNDILLDLKNLGIQENDTLFITADLMKVGYLGKTRSQTQKDWIFIFEKLLGEDGTFMTVSYTNSYPFFSLNKKKPFTKESGTNSGSLAKALLADKNSKRSSHPTNSYVAIGKNSDFLTRDHTEKGLCYDPTEKIIELRGKNLMLGTIDGFNAPMVFHYVQQVLGQTLKDPFSGLTGCYYKEDNKELKKFIRNDVGGCSSAGNKLYSYFIENDCITIGKVGNATSALIDAQKSFEVCYEIMKNNPKFSMCGDKTCISCYGKYSNVGIYSYYMRLNYFLKYLLR
jgi:aminoglycoside N3'-acetyltransferase